MNKNYGIPVSALPASLRDEIANLVRWKTAEFVPGRPWRNSYCCDPWGNAIELISASYAEVFAAWPQPGMEKATRMLARDGSEYVVAPRAT